MIDNGLIAWYKLDETGAGDAIDSVGGATGTATGTSYNTNGKLSGARTFALGDFIKTATINHNIGTGDFTFSAWLKIDSYTVGDTTGGSIMTSGELSPWFGIDSNQAGNNNSLSCYWGGWKGFNTPVSIGVWHNCILRRASGQIYAYLDGTLEASNYTVGTSMSNTYSYFGRSQSAAQDRLKGSLDDIRIYNRALSAAEIASLQTTPVSLNNCSINNARFNQ